VGEGRGRRRARTERLPEALARGDAEGDDLPGAVGPHVFSDVWSARIVRAAHGDSSGVRGAAWLWPLDDTRADRREIAPA
jgi:predicted NBD/HSP70 family sugar kinase